MLLHSRRYGIYLGPEKDCLHHHRCGYFTHPFVIIFLLSPFRHKSPPTDLTLENGGRTTVQ